MMYFNYISGFSYVGTLVDVPEKRNRCFLWNLNAIIWTVYTNDSSNNGSSKILSSSNNLFPFNFDSVGIILSF